MSWDAARLFLAVAEAGSLSGAARALHLSQPTVSRRLADLEQLLEEPLFERSGAGATLTAFGERLLEPARRMADWAGELTRAAERPHAPQGVVRITAAPGIAHGFVLPLAAGLRARYPDIELHVIATVRPLDLTRREADIALRLGGSADAGAIASIGLTLRPYASTSYRDRVGTRTNPAEIDWIGWAPPFDELSPNTTLARLVPGFRPAFAADDYLLQIRAAELGLGAILLARAPPGDDRPRLIELPLALPPIRRTLALLAPRSARAIPRVRAVLEPMVDALRAWGATREP